MNLETAKRLCEINTDFYQTHYASFSQTRGKPWAGWERCLTFIEDNIASAQQEFSVFDLACGNLRFENFLNETFSENTVRFHVIDNSEDLVAAELAPRASVEFQNLDIIGVMHEGLALSSQIKAPVCDISVSFGFLHHVPLQQHREEVMESLIAQTRPGGLVMVTFWRFLENEKLEGKARAAHERGIKELGLPALDENDILLDWKNTPGVYRYCHSFSEEEIDAFVDLVADKAELVARFVADGHTDNLNTYLLLKVQDKH